MKIKFNVRMFCNHRSLTQFIDFQTSFCTCKGRNIINKKELEEEKKERKIGKRKSKHGLSRQWHYDIALLSGHRRSDNGHKTDFVPIIRISENTDRH